jgi:hypothetical protein
MKDLSANLRAFLIEKKITTVHSFDVHFELLWLTKLSATEIT